MAWAEVNCGRVSYGYIHCTLWSWSICICASLVSSAFYDVEAHFTGVGGLDRSCLRHDKNMMMHIFWRQGFKKIWYFSLFPPFGIKYQTRFALSYPRSSNTNKTLDRGIISSGLWLDKSRNYDLNSFLICNSETSIGFTQKFRSAVRDIAPDSEIPIRHRLVYSSDFGICEGLCQSF